jgi:hypothetical protein
VVTDTADAAAPDATDAPLVSVIIPTWNRAAMLRLTLTTVLGQDLSDCEVLVIGDGCTDDSEAVVASFDDARLHWENLPVNSGAPSAPNNAGLRKARGRYIAHLGHDDFWLPWHLSGLVTTIAETGADWVYSLVVAIGPDGIRHCSGPPQPGVPAAEHHVPPSGWLYRREVFSEVGDWAESESIDWQIDFDYMRRAALASKRFALHDRPTALKFPSSLFPDGYRTGEPAPIQLAYFRRLQREPEALENEILRHLATRFAQLDRGGGKGIFARTAPAPAPGTSFHQRRRERLYLRGLTALPAPTTAPAGRKTPRRSDDEKDVRAARPRRRSREVGAAAARRLSRVQRRERRQRRSRRRALREAARAAPEQRKEA